MPFALKNDYIVVTNNRRHFLREYAKLDTHNGLIVIVPAVKRNDQQQLFGNALDALASENDDIVNKVVEVLLDASVHLREWTRGEHDIDHILNPKWGSP